jgi:hypothetical protein
MGKFIDKGVLYYLPEKKKLLVLKDVVYQQDRRVFVVPAGFESDGASIPRFAWSIIGHPFKDEYCLPALLHDYLYFKFIHWQGKSSRVMKSLSDKVFLQAMKDN